MVWEAHGNFNHAYRDQASTTRVCKMTGHMFLEYVTWVDCSVVCLGVTGVLVEFIAKE